jgi:predicted ester cyclase/ketosteroid isomerase-like protein
MKGRFVWVFAVVFLGILTSSCQTPGPTGLSDQDRAAILKVSVDGITLFNAPDRDFEAAVKFYYTEDAMTLSPNEQAVQGRASQIAWYQAYPPFELAEKIVELDGRGDLAYARLTYSLKVMMPGAEEPVVDTGKGMEIWKKQKDGSWKVSCDVFNSDLPMATPSEPGAVEQQNEALVRAVFEGLNKRNEAIYQELYAPEYRWYFPSANPKGLSREEEAGFVKLLRAGFPDCHWDVEEMVVHGDRVIVRFLFKGTHTGEFQGILPTGNKTEAGGIWMGRVKDGKFVECREENDFLGWMQQMGMELRPKEVKK